MGASDSKTETNMPFDVAISAVPLMFLASFASIVCLSLVRLWTHIRAMGASDSKTETTKGQASEGISQAANQQTVSGTPPWRKRTDHFKASSHMSSEDSGVKESVLRVSEYLELLQAGEHQLKPKIVCEAGKRQRLALPPGLEPFCPPMAGANVKNKLTDVIDLMIRSEKGSQQKPHDRYCYKGNALSRMVKLGSQNSENDDKTAEDAIPYAFDDLGVEKINRDQDLSEMAYWSDDDQAPLKISLASAHKLANRPSPPPKSLRKYVMQHLDADLDRNVAILLHHLRELNDRHRVFEQLPDRRRFVVGLKEVSRTMRNRTIKCLVVAPDVEENSASGGFDERLRTILRTAYEKDIPVIFALSRCRIGRAMRKTLRMSVVGVIDSTGVDALYENVLATAYDKRLSWVAEKRALDEVKSAKKTTKPLPPWRRNRCAEVA